MEKRNKKIILLALVMAAITTFIVYIYIRRDTPVMEERVYGKVCIAVNDITMGRAIRTEDLSIVQIDEEYIISGAVRDIGEAIGKIAGENIYEGEQILADRLSEIKDLKLSFDLPKGKRAVSIFVNRDTGLTDTLEPGDYVDVIATFPEERVEKKDVIEVYPKISGILLQNLRVLAIDNDRGLVKNLLEENTQGNTGQKTITLEIDAKDEEKFTYAAEYAILRLTLRGVGDHEPVESMPALREDLFNNRTYTLPKKETEN